MSKDKFIIFSFFSSFAFFLISFFISAYNFFNLKPGVSLILRFYSGQGIADFGNLFSLLLFNFSSLVFILFNLFLARFLFFRLRYFSYFLGFLSFLVSVLILIQVGVIISVN